MQPAEILEVAKQVRPDLVTKTASAIALLERMSPAHAEDLVQEVSAILTHTHEKTAAADYGAFGLGVAGTLTAGLGTAVASDLYDAAKRGLTKGRNFKNILEGATPELRAHYKEDPKKVKRIFDTIHRYAPEFTADPFYGAGLVQIGVESPESLIGTMKDILGARKSLREAKAKQYSAGHVHLERIDSKFPEQKELQELREKHDKTMAAFKYKSDAHLEQKRHQNAFEREKWKIEQMKKAPRS
jgi:hypothetical protein